MDNLENCLLHCTKEARELHVPNGIPRIHKAPTPFEFYKRWVACNSPFVLEGGVRHWPAFQKWNTSYLRTKLSNKHVEVAVTPNGYADAVHQGKFVMPEERLMAVDDFLDIMECRVEEKDVFYIQKQNSNLLTDLPELLPDIENGVPWATDGLEMAPDAINFWMGSERAITSLHKDPYENLYAVISGEKNFLLHPPCDRPFIPYQEFAQAKYRKADGVWRVEDLTGADPVPWIPVDPLNPDYDVYPMYRRAKAIECKVKAGDLFYLPSFWFHHVSQADSTVAVNFEFDIKYSYYQTLDLLTKNILGR